MIALIPARGGSVRIPRKNVKPFRGFPMLAYPVMAAKRSGIFSRVVVSTDDDEIASVAKEFGAEVVRREPDDGAKGTQQLAGETLAEHFPVESSACVIYPCSPMLFALDLIRAQQLMFIPHVSYVVSVQAEPLADAGCFYFGRAEAFRGGAKLYEATTMVYPLPADRCIDINTPEDWARAEEMFETLRRAV